MAKSDPLVDANYQENIYKYGVNLTNVAKEVDRIRKRMQAGRTNSNAQVLDRIYDSIDQLFNLTSFVFPSLLLSFHRVRTIISSS